jgi:hypothetical protein
MKLPASLGLGVVLGCAGCGSGIDVTRVSSSDKSLTGVPWNLAMTQYKLTVTREISACDRVLKGSVLVAMHPGRWATHSRNIYLTRPVGGRLATSHRDEERRRIARATEILAEVAGRKPAGWFSLPRQGDRYAKRRRGAVCRLYYPRRLFGAGARR